MTIEPIIFFDLIIAVFILVTGLTIFAVLYIRALNRLHSAKNDEEQLKERMNQRATVLLESARDKAFQIINEAGIRAKEIVGKTEVYDGEAKENLNRELKDISKGQSEALEKTSVELLKTYKDMLEELKQDNINIFKNISKDIEKDAIGEIKDFKEILQRETVAAQKVVEQKIEQEYTEVENEIKVYKDEQLKKIDDSIYEVLGVVSKLVIGKTIDMETHRDLVIEALNQAKSDLTKIE